MMTSATRRESRAVSAWGLFAMLLGVFLCLVPAAAHAQTADVAVSMIAAATVQPGGTITYNATVSNPGPDAATGLTLTLPLPGDATFTSLSTPGWTCSTPAVGSGGMVTCSVPVAPSGNGYGFSLTVTVPPTAAAGTVYAVTASVSSATADPASSNNTATASATVVAPTIAISPASLPGGSVGTAYSQTLVASGGVAPYSYALTAGAIPAGMSLSPTGVLSGTPAAGGTFNFTVTATDSSGPYTGSRAYSLIVSAAAPVASALAVTVPYTSAGLAIDLSPSIMGSYTSIAVTSGPLHGTTSIAGSVVTYTPAAGYFGPDSFSYTATGPGGTSAPAVVSIAGGSLTAPVAQPASVTVAAGSGSVSIDVTPLVTGAFTSTAIATAPAHGTATVSGSTITYAPAAGYGGPDSFTYTVTGPGGTSAPATISLTVQAATVTISSSSLGKAQVGVAYRQSVSASGGTGPYTYSLISGALPAGLTLSASGVIAGTPNAAGSFPITIRATDASGYFGSRSFTLVVTQAVPSAPSLTASVVAGTTGRVDVTQGATGGPFTRATIVSLSDPSAGSAFFEGGYRLAFTPAASFTGTAVVTYTLSNAFGTSAPATVTFTVIARPDPTRDADVLGLVNAQTRAA